MDFRMDLMNVLKGSAKGQAVMEYLITYGLALFVILIVLAILVAVVLPQLKAPENCQFSQPGFSCSTKKHVIVSDTANNNLVTAIVQLDNQQDKGINIYGVLCSSDVPGNINTATFTSAGSFVDTSVTSMNAGASTPVTLNCVEPAGQQQVSLAPGATFKGSIAVLYGFQDEVTGAPARLAIATITGTAQSSG